MLDIDLVIKFLFLVFLACFLINVLSQYSSALKKPSIAEITRFFTVLLGITFMGVMIYAIIVQYILLGL